MIPTPGPEERRQQERLVKARAGLGMVAPRKVPDGLAMIRAARENPGVQKPVDFPDHDDDPAVDLSSPAAKTVGRTPIPEPWQDVQALAWKSIVKEVCSKYAVTLQQVMGRQRSRRLVIARHEAFYRMSQETQMSLPAIGRRFGFDHTTVLHGKRMHEKRMKGEA